MSLPKYIPLDQELTFPMTPEEIEAEINRRCPIYTGTCRWERRQAREHRDALRQKITQLNKDATYTITQLRQRGSEATG